MRGWPPSRTVAVAGGGLVFVVCSLLPLACLLAEVLSSGDRRSASLWLDVRQRALLWNTALLGTGTAVLATALGAPLGVALARVALPLKRFVRLALAMPVLLPPYVVALAWSYLGGSRWLADWIYSLPGAIVVLSLLYYPLCMLATEVAMRRIDGRLEEAGSLAAPPVEVFLRITLPLAAPSVLAAALLVFVLAISEFGVPGLLRVRVFTTEVFTAFAALYDFSRAMLLTLPLLALCVIVAVVAARIVGDELVTSRRPVGNRARVFEGGRRVAGFAATVVVAAAVGLPVLLLTREALGARSLRTAFEGSAPAIARSLVLAAIGATAVVTVAASLGYARARARGRLGQLADVAFIVAFAVPSTIVGVGLIAMWNRPGILGAAYGTDAMLILAYMGRFVPVAALILAAAIRYVPVSHEEAAAMAGAGWTATFLRIVLSQTRLGLLAAWMIAFTLAFGELGASVLVAPPGEATLPIRVYTLIANTPPSHVAVLALLQTGVILGPIAVLATALPRRGHR